MSLAFLTKKSFHTTTVRNVEKVWMAEQKKEEEERRKAQIMQQMRDEAEVEALRNIHLKAQGKSTAPRLSWMYEAPGGGVNLQDQHLLGKPVENAAETQNHQLSVLKRSAGSLFMTGTTDPVRDAQQKIKDDPMLQILQAQRESIKQIKANPVQVAKLKDKLAKAAEKKKLKKAKKRQKEGTEEEQRKQKARP
eukprot:gnl/Spiro4/21359_TR10436_c0_g1_i1.p1 gnl/Spiro4/21359_TR10436_c0_g1~~gnl/Spiro4/21359_TR10436_c0_g1_i1.p1  ORF type:complete len:207 (+),score=60.60 gnl/Spiro4/21359_TR10436_c0_g1_i1:44-622(+)